MAGYMLSPLRGTEEVLILGFEQEVFISIKPVLLDIIADRYLSSWLDY